MSIVERPVRTFAPFRLRGDVDLETVDECRIHLWAYAATTEGEVVCDWVGPRWMMVLITTPGVARATRARILATRSASVPLVCAPDTSAYTSVLMPVYCMEVKKPRMRACTTISQTGVWAPTVANDTIISPTRIVLPSSTLR